MVGAKFLPRFYHPDMWAFLILASIPLFQNAAAFTPKLLSGNSKIQLPNLCEINEGVVSISPINDEISIRNSRKQFLRHSIQYAGALLVSSTAVCPPVASAANLPKSTGADLSQTGSIEALVPIVILRQILVEAKSRLRSSSDAPVVSSATISTLKDTIAKIPKEEVDFYRIFDAYSDPVSYKQKFMDQNAFLVYYTKGFDGVGRPGLESGDVPLQTLQYGARNDAWAAMDDFLVELKFGVDGSSELVDIVRPLNKALNAVESYLSYAPVSDVEEASRRASR